MTLAVRGDCEGPSFVYADPLAVAATIDEILLPYLTKCADRIQAFVNTLE